MIDERDMFVPNILRENATHTTSNVDAISDAGIFLLGFFGSLVSRVAVTKTSETFWYFRFKVLENHRGHRGTQRGRKRKITTLCDPLCPLWFNLPCHNQILWKGEKVCATRITREPKKPRDFTRLTQEYGIRPGTLVSFIFYIVLLHTFSWKSV